MGANRTDLAEGGEVVHGSVGVGARVAKGGQALQFQPHPASGPRNSAELFCAFESDDVCKKMSMYRLQNQRRRKPQKPNLWSTETAIHETAVDVIIVAEHAVLKGVVYPQPPIEERCTHSNFHFLVPNHRSSLTDTRGQARGIRGLATIGEACNQHVVWELRHVLARNYRRSLAYPEMRKYGENLIFTVQRYGGNTARLSRRSDEALGVRVSVARIAPSLLDLGHTVHSNNLEMSMEQRRNTRVGETGDHRENPPASGIVRHDLTCVNLPAGNRTRSTLVEGDYPCRWVKAIASCHDDPGSLLGGTKSGFSPSAKRVGLFMGQYDFPVLLPIPAPLHSVASSISQADQKRTNNPWPNVLSLAATIASNFVGILSNPAKKAKRRTLNAKVGRCSHRPRSRSEVNFRLQPLRLSSEIRPIRARRFTSALQNKITTTVKSWFLVIHGTKKLVPAGEGPSGEGVRAASLVQRLWSGRRSPLIFCPIRHDRGRLISLTWRAFYDNEIGMATRFCWIPICYEQQGGTKPPTRGGALGARPNNITVSTSVLAIIPACIQLQPSPLQANFHSRKEGRPSKGGLPGFRLRTKDDAMSGVRRANSARGVLLAADSGEDPILDPPPLFRPAEDEFAEHHQEMCCP
ncbi:hypothetical protein PR048_008282 [Dryococelus australis]|uniref:Uncharacterized protein n=1 Tax=Dryococelus australis TaxID=614101 RepID=A0ABQ9HXK2_9NEOP|nr:hypothetical protein PR048_008282 [Dryococelus australis]